jgi:hypothetical protein
MKGRVIVPGLRQGFLGCRWPGFPRSGHKAPLAHGQQRSELVTARPHARLPNSVSEVATGGQGIRVLRAADPLDHRDQGSELVTGPARIPRSPSPAGEVSARRQGIRVLRAADPLATLNRRLLLVLFAFGTNMGIRQMAVTGEHGVGEAALRHVRAAYVTRENLRAAVTTVVNATRPGARAVAAQRGTRPHGLLRRARQYPGRPGLRDPGDPPLAHGAAKPQPAPT